MGLFSNSLWAKVGMTGMKYRKFRCAGYCYSGVSLKAGFSFLEIVDAIGWSLKT